MAQFKKHKNTYFFNIKKTGMKTKQLFFLLLAFNLCLLATSPLKANDGKSEQHEKSGSHENDDHNKGNHDDKDKDHQDGNDNDKDKDHHEGNDNDHHEGNDHENDKGDDKDHGGNRVPIDGGIGILLAAGIGYGVKKVMNRNKAKAENNQI
ncbi:MAG: hypothetical protein NVSMB67_29550 [Flavisolibacter sp.]